MIVIMKPEAKEQEVKSVITELKEKGMEVQINNGVECVVLGIIGNTHLLDKEKIAINPAVDRVIKVQEPYKKANRKFHPEDTIVDVAGRQVGGGTLTVIAGPCSVESEEQIEEIAKDVKESGATFLRGGAYKPRTSPYAFQGLELDGLALLRHAREMTGLPIVSELTAPRHLDEFIDTVDIIQVGARNMQNFDLLREVGKSKKPVLLKRGLSNTIEELLPASEYILNEGNEDVILCERGIRTFETFTRNTLDISAIPVLKKLTHLPVIVDPSHASGLWWTVEPLALAAIAAGADGIMVEVHNDPKNALCDGMQSITPNDFDKMMKKARRIAAVNEKIEETGV